MRELSEQATHTTGTSTEALNRSVTELRRLIATVGPETSVGLALATIKGNLQRIELGVAVDRDQWLLVAAALRRAQGGSP